MEYERSPASGFANLLFVAAGDAGTRPLSDNSRRGVIHNTFLEFVLQNFSPLCLRDK
jgi:hypothetical protein